MMTTAQKELIIRLLRKQEFDLGRTNAFHRQLAEEARIQKPNGRLVDEWLAALTSQEISALILHLRK